MARIVVYAYRDRTFAGALHPLAAQDFSSHDVFGVLAGDGGVALRLDHAPFIHLTSFI
ncbi:hypothetical protein [Limnohabitans sp. Rim8]|uniref:hypothetical protein n=1 Tax=Limnohabitans sp. Rim8 TaxID=1100718 RepID=UPI00330661CF